MTQTPLSHRLTDEQQQIVDHQGSMTINAVAGSGKTTVILEHARQHQDDGPNLYVVFNRTARETAHRKASEMGIRNLSVVTAHSLAYRHIRPNPDSLTNGHSLFQVLDLLGLRGKHNYNAELIIARHILRLISYYCNSSVQRVRDLDYSQTLNNKRSSDYLTDFFDEIYDGARRLLTLMYQGQIPITHDYYLKMFQLSAPRMEFKRIYFDEAQDASEVMVDVVRHQSAHKIMVGDNHQRIYGWRFAVNSMNTEGENYKLTGSFRFGKAIAEEAQRVLNWKQKISDPLPIQITGLGNVKINTRTEAYLARTNAGILDFAVRLTEQSGNQVSFYFEGGFNSYLFGSESSSVYDIFNLYIGEYGRIRDPFVRSFQSFDAVKHYIECTEDSEMGVIVEMVEKYGKNLMRYISMIRSKVMPDDRRHEADYIFSTVHRCKGLEYDEVHLADDFIREKDVYSMIQKQDAGVAPDKINEEINILYVAVTRSRAVLHHEGRVIS